jgi:uncharacterized membrane protein YbjE (DUF340 family)
MNNENNLPTQNQSQYKRSFLKIALMFVLGFILGWFIGIPLQKYLQGAVLFMPLILGVVFGILGGKKRKIEQAVSQEKMSNAETLIVVIATILNPILFGAIFYFVWRGKYPTKAKQSNKISMIVFLIELVAYVLYNVLTGEL